MNSVTMPAQASLCLVSTTEPLFQWFSLPRVPFFSWLGSHSLP